MPSLVAFAVSLLVVVASFASAGAASRPTVAVLADTGGVDASSLADAVIESLVNRGDFRVIDRQHVQEELATQRGAEAGQVTPETETKIGRKLGANYLLVVRVANVGASAGNAGRSFGIPHLGIPLTIPGSGPKTSLDDSIKIIDISSGEIVQTVDDQRSGGTDSSARATLFADSAKALADKIDVARMPMSASSTNVEGHIIDVQGDEVTLSLGRSSGIQENDIVDAFASRLVEDGGKTIRTRVKRGSLQVMQVETDYSIAKPIGGFHAVKSEIVRVAAP